MTIKEIRKRTNLTQAQFAKAIGCSKRSVENWEEGKSSPAPYLVKLIQYYAERELIKKDT